MKDMAEKQRREEERKKWWAEHYGDVPLVIQVLLLLGLIVSIVGFFVWPYGLFTMPRP